MVNENEQPEEQASSGRRWLPSVRGVVIGVLLVLGALLTVTANVGVWSQRALFDEAGFADRVNAVFQDEDVQNVIALRVTDEVSTALEIDETVEDALAQIEDGINSIDVETPGDVVDVDTTERDINLGLLARPLAAAFDRLIFEATLGVLNSDAFQAILDTSVRFLYSQVDAIIFGDDDALLKESDGEIVLDISPVLLEAVDQAGGEELIEFLDLPDDAGTVVLGTESDVSWLGEAIRFADKSFALVLLLPIVIFAAAILLSKSRRLGLMGVGIAVALSCLVQILALVGVDEIFVNLVLDPENKSAARDTLQILFIDDLRDQSMLLLLGALIVVGGTWVMGGSDLATDIRARVLRLKDGVTG